MTRLAVLPGVNRELSGGLRYQRHLAQAKVTGEVLERLGPAEVKTPAELRDLLCELCTSPVIVLTVWLELQLKELLQLVIVVSEH